MFSMQVVSLSGSYFMKSLFLYKYTIFFSLTQWVIQFHKKYYDIDIAIIVSEGFTCIYMDTNTHHKWVVQSLMLCLHKAHPSFPRRPHTVHHQLPEVCSSPSKSCSRIWDSRRHHIPVKYVVMIMFQVNIFL